MPSSRRKAKRTMLFIRISFIVYVSLLLILTANIFLFSNKDYISYESVIAGIAYLFHVRLILRNMEGGRSAEMTFYFLALVVVAVCAVFLFVADKISGGQAVEYTPVD